MVGSICGSTQLLTRPEAGLERGEQKTSGYRVRPVGLPPPAVT
jgi:hypothetical protein